MASVATKDCLSTKGTTDPSDHDDDCDDDNYDNDDIDYDNDDIDYDNDYLLSNRAINIIIPTTMYVLSSQGTSSTKYS